MKGEGPRTGSRPQTVPGKEFLHEHTGLTSENVVKKQEGGRQGQGVFSMTVVDLFRDCPLPVQVFAAAGAGPQPETCRNFHGGLPYAAGYCAFAMRFGNIDNWSGRLHPACARRHTGDVYLTWRGVLYRMARRTARSRAVAP